jgi:hypothetical protein
MRRGVVRVGIGVAALVFAGLVYVWFFGSAIVHDETGAVESAVITNDRQEQALIALPGGYFFAVPGMEGVIEVRCRGGARGRAGYVTGHFQTWVKVIGDAPCRRVVEWR